MWIFFISVKVLFSQPHSSRDNYTGAWETPESWDPIWTVPLTNLNGNDITIKGYITRNGSLSFKGNANKLIVNDTLVIIGDLLLDNNNDIIINDNGILIVRGNFTINNQTIVTSNGSLIVSGNLSKNGSQGTFTSNDNPVKVFIGGTISPADLTSNNTYFSALNCTTSTTDKYLSSKCSYGDLTDLLDDPIYSFFQSTCPITVISIIASGPLTFCAGGSVTLTSSAGARYLWSTGETSQGINVKNTGSYTVLVTTADGCTNSATQNIIVRDYPVAIAGTDQQLEFAFETEMNAELAAGETGEWSLISGSGKIIEKNSPGTLITDLSIGKNIFSWKVSNGACEAGAEVKITVKDLFVPSVITPNGDGINDYFKLNAISDQFELIIFNLWGNLEYSNRAYSNNWDGRNNNGAELPEDTYYYLLKLGNGKTKRGSVLIKR